MTPCPQLGILKFFRHFFQPKTQRDMVSPFNASTLTVIKGSIQATVDSLDNMGVDSAIERILGIYSEK